MTFIGFIHEDEQIYQLLFGIIWLVCKKYHIAFIKWYNDHNIISDIKKEKKNTITRVYRTLNLLSKLLCYYTMRHIWRKQHSRAKRIYRRFQTWRIQIVINRLFGSYIYISTRYIVRWVFAHYARFSYPTFEWKLFGKFTDFVRKLRRGWMNTETFQPCQFILRLSSLQTCFESNTYTDPFCHLYQAVYCFEILKCASFLFWFFFSIIRVFVDLFRFSNGFFFYRCLSFLNQNIFGKNICFWKRHYKQNGIYSIWYDF